MASHDTHWGLLIHAIDTYQVSTRKGSVADNHGTIERRNPHGLSALERLPNMP